MSYQEAIEKADAKIHAFQSFGSYQGDWWAKVTFKEATGWVYGYYDSCSVCDTFKREFGYNNQCKLHKYANDTDEVVINCKLCQCKKASYEFRIVAFGLKYLDDIISKDEALAIASENLDWDMDTEEIIKFITAN